MEFHEKLYTADLSAKDTKIIQKKINKGKNIEALYCIVLPLFNDGILEIYEYNQLLNTYLKHINNVVVNKIVIVGLATSNEEAIYAVAYIVDKVFQETGKADVRKYFD